MSRFSKRTGWELGESSYAVAVRESRTSNSPFYDLTISNPTVCGFAYDTEAIIRALSDPRALIYSPDARGLPAAREAVAAYYADHGAQVHPDDLLMTTSTSESYSFLFRLLCDPGDEVLIARPSYPLFDFLAGLDDVVLRPYPLFFDHGWWIDFAELERSLSPRTRAIVVVHPNNPTGHWTGPGERHRLEQLCAARGLALIVDEVFLDYPLVDPPGVPAPPRSFAAADHPALTFVLSGISKVAALPQMKAAWLAALGPPALVRDALARLEVIADTFLSMSAPVQLALPAWLAGRSAIQQQISARTMTNLRLVQQISSSGSGIHAIEVAAGWSVILRLAGCVGDRACADRLARQFGVAVHPGSFYGLGAGAGRAQSDRVIVSLLGPPEDLQAGLARISDSEIVEAVDEPK